ncbi:MAG TPA: hypothetical protein DHW02_14165 [Ktedonobacter sp.]|nr:hypothetical protein [Ktedonobacter sp.]
MSPKAIDTFISTFPERIRAAYIQGSYADNSNVNTSDIDLLIIFKGNFQQEEQQQSELLAKQCIAESAIELDIELVDEQSLVGGISPTFKYGSRLVYGEDIRDRFPLVSLIEWTRDRMHSSLWRTGHLFGRSGSVSYPLDYPDPQGEFYGYDARLLKLPHGREVHCTRDLIRLVGWSATAILAYKAKVYVARKSECHTLYKAHFDDEWGQLVQDIYELCRGKWNYLIPEDEDERRVLRRICERTLMFENHFLRIYKEFMIKELDGNDEQGRQEAMQVLQRVNYRDDDVRNFSV